MNGSLWIGVRISGRCRSVLHLPVVDRPETFPVVFVSPNGQINVVSHHQLLQSKSNENFKNINQLYYNGSGLKHAAHVQHAARKRVQCGTRTSGKMTFLKVFKHFADFFQYLIGNWRFSFVLLSMRPMRSFLESRAVSKSIWVWDPCIMV